MEEQNNIKKYKKSYLSIIKNSSKSTVNAFESECIESSGQKEKKKILSPSPVKPSYQQSPSPRVLFDQVAKKLVFEKLQSSPYYTDVCKRKQTNCPEIAKRKKNQGPTIGFVNFFDSETDSIKKFKCYPDNQVTENSEITKNLAQNECDDDCATSKNLLLISKGFLINEVSRELEKLNEDH